MKKFVEELSMYDDGQIFHTLRIFIFIKSIMYVFIINIIIYQLKTL